ncbi:MAG: HAD family hydrolase [Bacteroidota bacterium]
MKIKAIIFDLDNTIYPVSSIAQKLFYSVFRAIENEGRHNREKREIETEIMRRPFQAVAKEFGFSDVLTSTCLHLLSKSTYNDPMHYFEDYPLTREIGCVKFLVTMGFAELQWSKINSLDIKADFENIFIVDPSVSGRTKRDVFGEIMTRYGFASDELLVVGDDLNSEIKAGKELGIKTVLYDYLDQYKNLANENVIHSFRQIEQFL